MKTARGILRPWLTAAAVGLAASAARPQSLQGEGGTPMEVRSLSATAAIEGRVARVTLDETFFNPSGREIEATFLLPLPAGATVERFSMWVDGVETAGELLDSGRARGVYEGIVRSRRDPGLLESAGEGVFRARVFPVPARGEKRVKITWTEVLSADGGSTTWRLPMSRAARASVAVDVATERPLSSAWSPTHGVETVRKDDRHVRVSYEATDLKADRAFVLVVQEPSGDVGFTLLASRPAGEAEGSFLAVLSPAVVAGERPVPRDMVLCCDTSGSMAGPKIAQARGALLHAVSTLSPEDRFSVVTFATEPRAFRDALVPATPDNVEAARAFVATLEAVGGTAIDEALGRSLRMLAGGDAARPAVVLFLTDGLPTIGEADPARIVARAKAAAGDRVRMFTFGVGNDVNTTLLDSLAADLRGARDYVAPGEDIEARVSALVEKTRFPVITDLRVEVLGVEVSGLYPRRLPDLFRGSELVIAGRYAGPGEATFRVTGRSGEGERTFERKVSFPALTDASGFVDRLWAVRRVGHLLDEIRLKGTSIELREEVVRLAKKHSIVTPFTSYLVLEPGADASGIDASVGDPRFEPVAPSGGIGAGGGAGGTFGARSGGKRNVRMDGGAGTEALTEPSLEFLKTRVPAADVGDTGLHLLAFLGYGETHKTPRYGMVIRAGLKDLKGLQDVEGCFGDRGPGYLLRHAQASLAMNEAYGLTQSPLFKASAQGGVDFLQARRLPGGGWGEGTFDLLTTAWAVSALWSARGACLLVDPAALAEAADRIAKAIDPATGSAGTPAETAAAGLARLMAGGGADDPLVLVAADRLIASPPPPGDAEGWSFATSLLFQVGGDRWKAFNEKLKAQVLGIPRAPGEEIPPRQVALRALTTEVYYRYARVFGGRTGPVPKPAPATGEDAVKASREAKRLSEAGSADEGE
jgi:Ca-activated chloride channel family protein